MKKVQARTHREVLRPLLRNKSFRKGYEDHLRKLRVADTLVRLRIHRGLTQTELAIRIGATQPFIAKVEAGRNQNFSLETLVKLADALDSELEIRFRPVTARAA
jgi:DNA-binding XRE family transcriptional regulator